MGRSFEPRFDPPIEIRYEGEDQPVHQLDENGELYAWCSDMSCPCTAELYKLIGDLNHPCKEGDE